MRVAGEKIKTARKKKKLSQAELAKGICTQATISNIENKNVCDSLDIFSSVCLRLDLQVEECIEGSSEKKLESLLNKVEELCFYFKHDEAYDLLKDYPDDIESSNRILETKFFYYKGITSLLGKKNNSEALFYLHRGSEISRDINIYNIHLVVGLLGKPKHVQYYANIERAIDTSGMLILDYGDVKVVCIGAKDSEATIRSTIQGTEGSVVVNGPTNTLDSYTTESLSGEKETFDHKDHPHRMYDEFKLFSQVIKNKDMDFVKKQLEHSKIVMEIVEAAINDAGIVLG